jgi:hypothetical protein
MKNGMAMDASRVRFVQRRRLAAVPLSSHGSPRVFPKFGGALDLAAGPVFGEHCALPPMSLEFPTLWRCSRQHTAPPPFPPSGV